MRFRFLAVPGFALAMMASEPVTLVDAVKDENRKQVESLIRSGVDLNAAQPDWATPLAWAV